MAYKPKNIKERTLHRLKIAQGHLAKVSRMLEEDKYCIDIIHQSRAVQNALKEIDILILENHLKTCVSESIKAGREDEVVAEVVNIFKRT